MARIELRLTTPGDDSTFLVCIREHAPDLRSMLHLTGASAGRLVFPTGLLTYAVVTARPEGKTVTAFLILSRGSGPWGYEVTVLPHPLHKVQHILLPTFWHHVEKIAIQLHAHRIEMEVAGFRTALLKQIEKHGPAIGLVREGIRKACIKDAKGDWADLYLYAAILT